MAEHKMPEPVAWRCNWNKSGEIAWVQYHDETDPLPEKWDVTPNETLPLYSAETVQSLQAEANEQARLNGMGAEREARLMAQVAELRAERDALANTDAGPALALLSRMRFACGDNGLRMQDELEDYLRGLAKDAARYRWLRERWGRIAEEYEDDRMTFIGREKNDGEGWYTDPDSVDAAIDAAMAEGER